MKSNPLPSPNRLKQILDYDAETGVFVWRETLSNAQPKGNVAGCKGAKGYIHICIDGFRYGASRLAWMYMTGDDPEDAEIDHINRKRDDNRFCNLRLADRSENCRNINVPRHNTSGAKGVSRRATTGKWEAYLYIRKQRKHLGFFDSFESAVAVRASAESLYFNGITGGRT